ncbi:MAG: Ig-like domain-containing protein [Kofleriaceae bacterium]
MSSVGTACTDQSSFTNLNPDGPPALAEVRLKETYQDSGSSTSFLSRRVFAFGTFPAAPDDQNHAVSTASVTGQSLRIIMDELLVGNNLEEVQCRGPVDDDAFSSVPLGATPDDIAACSVNSDALKSSCKGDHAVCICQIDAGCGAVAKGDPVGVLDVNSDGAADNTTFKAGAVGIQCGSIAVPIDLDISYWNPSGDQQVPAAGGYDALGPAIILAPKGGLLPTNIKCGLTFADSIVDKQGEKVCAPPAGRPKSCDGKLEDCPQDLMCTPGDLSAFSFSTDALRVTVLGITDNAMNVSTTNPIFVNANAPLDPATAQNITITPPPPGGFTITLTMSSQVKFTFTTPLAAATTYTITFPTTLTDSFGQGLVAPITIHFTTA